MTTSNKVDDHKPIVYAHKLLVDEYKRLIESNLISESNQHD